MLAACARIVPPPRRPEHLQLVVLAGAKLPGLRHPPHHVAHPSGQLLNQRLVFLAAGRGDGARPVNACEEERRLERPGCMWHAAQAFSIAFMKEPASSRDRKALRTQRRRWKALHSGHRAMHGPACQLAQHFTCTSQLRKVYIAKPTRCSSQSTMATGPTRSRIWGTISGSCTICVNGGGGGGGGRRKHPFVNALRTRSMHHCCVVLWCLANKPRLSSCMQRRRGGAALALACLVRARRSGPSCITSCRGGQGGGGATPVTSSLEERMRCRVAHCSKARHHSPANPTARLPATCSRAPAGRA